MSKSEPATRQDVEEIVGRVVGEIATNMLQLISEQLVKVDKRFDRVDADLNRIENKLDATADKVDDHEIRLKQLEPETV